VTRPVAGRAGLPGIGLVAGGLLFLGRRLARVADARIDEAVGDVSARMDALAAELRSSLERAETRAEHERRLGSLAASVDLDEVLARTLELAAELIEADAALVWLPGAAAGKPLVATLGLSRAEAERQGGLPGPPDGRVARAVGFAFHYTARERTANGSLIHAGIAVPLRSAEDDLGYLAAFTRSPERRFEDEDADRLEAVAGRAGPAIDNALRFRAARQLADLDALTGLHNRRYFHETLAREVARAHRYGRSLALVVLDIDDFKDVNDRIGHLAGDSVLAEAAERVRAVVRSADIPCRVGGDEFAVILPESTLADAELLSRRVQHAFAAAPFPNEGPLGLSAGIAEVAPDDDAGSLFERADAALYQAKGAGKGRVVVSSR
jgi:diguanylate cyclase (GGDEF)-like protein